MVCASDFIECWKLVCCEKKSDVGHKLIRHETDNFQDGNEKFFPSIRNMLKFKLLQCIKTRGLKFRNRAHNKQAFESVCVPSLR